MFSWKNLWGTLITELVNTISWRRS